MAMARKTRCIVDALPGYAGEIGHWLWMMEEVRRGTLKTVQGLSQEVLDWEGPEGGENSIGTLLYHVALVEIDWLYADIRGTPYPGPVAALFPHPDRAGKRLAPVHNVTLEGHLDRLGRSRKVFLADLAGMSQEDWRRPRSPAGADYEVTPEWVVFHLVEHEARHAEQMRFLKVRAERR
jgi:uncharacterized damage-inducible protein DinB